MKINKILTFLLFGLILVILIELGIIFLGISYSSNKVKKINYFLTNKPFTTSFLPSRPINTVAHDGSKITYVYGILNQSSNEKGEIVFKDKDNNLYRGKLTSETLYFSRIKTKVNGVMVDYDKKINPFVLEKNIVYLFLWTKSYEKGNIIILDKIVKIE